MFGILLSVITPINYLYEELSLFKELNEGELFLAILRARDYINIDRVMANVYDAGSLSPPFVGVFRPSY